MPDGNPTFILWWDRRVSTVLMVSVSEPSRPYLCGSNDQLHGELDLARRTCLAGWESGTRNSAERRSSDHVPGLAEVCMIKKIKKLNSKLCAELFAKRGVLDD